MCKGCTPIKKLNEEPLVRRKQGSDYCDKVAVWSEASERKTLGGNQITVSLAGRDKVKGRTSPMSDTIPAFTTSVVNSLLWQAGTWKLTAAEISKFASWEARDLFVVSGGRRIPTNSIGGSCAVLCTHPNTEF